MFYVVVFMFTLTKGYQATGDNSSTDQPMLLLPPPPESRRFSSKLVENLRRQLMKNNYDYQNGNSDEDKLQKKQKGANIPPHVRNEFQKQPASNHNYEPESKFANERREAHDNSGEDALADDMTPAVDALADEVPPAVDALADEVPPDMDAAATHDSELRDVRTGPNFSPDRRENAQDNVESYDLTYSLKRRDGYLDALQGASVSNRHRSLTSARGRHSVQDKHSKRDEQEDQEPDSQETDYSDNRAEMQDTYDALDAHHLKRPVVTRANRLKHYVSTTQPPPQREPNISKKDLLYYADEDKLRRHNDVSAELSLSDSDTEAVDLLDANKTSDVTKKQQGEGARRHNARTEKPSRVQVVTVSGNNVTYKILTMKSHNGRRSGARRFLEERAPDSVSLISLDRAPFPDFRLPRTRRQYMHEKQDHRNPLGDLVHRHHRRHK